MCPVQTSSSAKKQKTVVIVESPAKATTIERYLGTGYTVLASYGHVRDLVNKTGSVDPEHGFSMTWAPTPHATKHIDAILKAAKSAGTLVLATDPDREGEAIAWHVSQLITQKYGDATPAMQRVVFHEITKNVVRKAMEEPRSLDTLLVDAYLARRALDYLVGYSISPILWQKLPGARSAGRVQSVALRLVVEREQDIEKFKSQEFWSLDGLFETAKKSSFKARLIVHQGHKLSKFAIPDEATARTFEEAVRAETYHVDGLEKKQVRRFPTPPFTTSTLQQEASRKLGFGASRTMRTAQRLYEGVTINGESVGLITYMRTDSVNLSQESLKDMRTFIKDGFGPAYLPKEPRVYKTKTKNAQEAHEAIRPTSVFRRPEDVAAFLDEDQLKLYHLIWRRALASQMENAVFDQVTAEITDASGATVFRAVGTTQVFDGFLKLYQEGRDEGDKGDDEDSEAKLPPLQKGETVTLSQTLPEQHFTQPPPRFTEASLVKQLEELGIGRPSTYAPVMQILQDREYVTLERRQFIPSVRGRIVTAFLTHFCGKYVEYDFTAHLEEQLDDIAEGSLGWKTVMNDFWTDFSKAIGEMKTIAVPDVMATLETELETFLFGPEDAQDGGEHNPRVCPKCGTGHLGLKLSRFGAFLGCSHYPDCTYRVPLGVDNGDAASATFEPIDLGVDPADHAAISLRRGPYGFYIQVDFPEPPTENPLEEEASAKPKRGRKKKTPTVKRIGLPAAVDPGTVTLEMALRLKALPKILGQHEGQDVSVNLGRFGPFVKWGTTLASVPKSADFMTLPLEEAVRLITEKLAKPASARKGGRTPAAAKAEKPAPKKTTRKATSRTTQTGKKTPVRRTRKA